MNLSTKSNHSSGGGGGESEGDAPLNLSLKSGGDAKMDSASPGNSLQSLSSITAALGGSSGGASAGGKSNERSGEFLCPLLGWGSGKHREDEKRGCES